MTREPGDLPDTVVLLPAGVRRQLRGKPSRRQVGVVAGLLCGLSNRFMRKFCVPALGHLTRRTLCVMCFFIPPFP